jgi:hypothetical protein
MGHGSDMTERQDLEAFQKFAYIAVAVLILAAKTRTLLTRGD